MKVVPVCSQLWPWAEKYVFECSLNLCREVTRAKTSSDWISFLGEKLCSLRGSPPHSLHFLSLFFLTILLLPFLSFYNLSFVLLVSFFPTLLAILRPPLTPSSFSPSFSFSSFSPSLPPPPHLPPPAPQSADGRRNVCGNFCG